MERTVKCGGNQPFAPNFIATAIIADASRYTHRDEARGGEGRNCSGGLRGCVRAIMVQQRSNRNAFLIRHTNEIGGLNSQNFSERKNGGEGKGGFVRLELGGRRSLKKKTNNK